MLSSLAARSAGRRPGWAQLLARRRLHQLDQHAVGPAHEEALEAVHLRRLRYDLNIQFTGALQPSVPIRHRKRDVTQHVIVGGLVVTGLADPLEEEDDVVD